MSHWPYESLCKVGIVSTGSTPSTNDESLWGRNIPFVTPSDLDQIAPIVTSDRWLSSLGGAAARLLPENSVLVCCIGSLGKIGIAGTQLATNQQINAITFDESYIFPKYGFFACRQLRKKLEAMAPATTIPIVSKSKFERLQIPVPPLPEQRRIAAILDKAEALRAKRRAALAKLDQLAQSIFLEMFGDPVSNPKCWPLNKFLNIGKLDRGVSKYRPRNAPELLNGPYPLVQTGDVANSGGYIREYKQTYSEIGLKQSRIWPSGTLCITIAANIAKTGILTFDACFPDSVVGFTPNDLCNSEFVRTWLSFLQKMLEDSAPESAQKNINLEILRNLDIPLPPIPLQQAFAKRIEAIESLKASHRASLAKLDALFASLQDRAFRGEL